jgi:hypothetical protein
MSIAWCVGRPFTSWLGDREPKLNTSTAVVACSADGAIASFETIASHAPL